MYIYIYLYLYENLIEKVFITSCIIIDTTSFMLGNLQSIFLLKSIFLPTKTKKLISNTKKQTHIKVNHYYHPLVCLIIVYLYVDTLI